MEKEQDGEEKSVMTSTSSEWDSDCIIHSNSEEAVWRKRRRLILTWIKDIEFTDLTMGY